MRSTRHQQRREVFYRGHVQGVGFRYTTQQIARDFDVSGFVQNLSDGRVLLVVESDSDQLTRFLGEIDDRLGEYIDEVNVAQLAPSGEFTSFSIRY